MPGRHTVPRAERWGAIQALSRIDVKTTIQLPIDAKYVTKGVTQRDELEYGPTGDLVNSFSIERRAQWQNRSHQGQVTLGGCWPISDPARQLVFHHMLANSLADVVAEEAAKSLLPDMTFDQKAERAGVSRLGLLETAVVSTLSSFEKTGWRDRQHKSSTREAQERFEVSGMQHLSCLQAVQILGKHLAFLGQVPDREFRAKNRQHSIAVSSDLTDDSATVRKNPHPIPPHLQPLRNRSSLSMITGRITDCLVQGVIV